MELGRLVIAIVLAVLAPSGAADWLQTGYDAARTGHVPQVPEWNDVALEIPFEIMDDIESEPVVVGRRVFVLDDGPGVGRIHSFDLDAPGAPQVLVELGSDADYFVSDGERLLVLEDAGSVSAYALDGAPAWRTGLVPGVDSGTPLGGGSPLTCQSHSMAVAEGQLVVMCEAGVFATPVVFGLDPQTGDLRWRWAPSTEPPGEISPDEDPLAAVTASGEEATRAARLPNVIDRSITVAQGLVFVMTAVDVTDPAAEVSRASGWALYAVNATSGQTAWIEEGTAQLPGGGARWNQPPAVAYSRGRLYVEVADQALVMTVDGDRLVDVAPLVIRDAPAWEGDPGSGFGVTQTAAYATSRTRIHRVGPDLTIEWTYPPASATAGEEWAHGGLVATEDVILARAEPVGSSDIVAGAPFLYAIDARLGEPVWRHRFDRNVHVAVSDGLVIAAGAEGSAAKLVVLGRMPGSLTVVPAASDLYPDPGDAVSVEVGSAPGFFGPATEYRADWGDGEETPWQSSPLFTHRYSVPADVTARFYARNAAGQTSSVPVEFYVGDTSRLPFLAQQFTRDNQERTFFVLGLAATGGAGVFGLVRLSRKRDRFQRELAAVEQAHSMTRDRPTECEAALAERKAHCQGLFLDGKLEEGQFALLARRIDDLRASLRLQVIDERLEFLPLGMVKALQGVLEDGRVSAWERRHFLEALDRDRLLGPDQKAQVRTLIDEWFERDSGAARLPDRP